MTGKQGCLWYTILGTCESVFWFKSNLESNRPYTTQATTQTNTSVFCICDEREWCTDYRTPNWVLVYFYSVVKRVKQCCFTLILLPKLTSNANLTTTNRFFTNDDWQRGRLENFQSGPSIRIESRIGRTIWNRIESRSFAGPYTIWHIYNQP